MHLFKKINSENFLFKAQTNSNTLLPISDDYLKYILIKWQCFKDYKIDMHYTKSSLENVVCSIYLHLQRHKSDSTALLPTDIVYVKWVSTKMYYLSIAKQKNYVSLPSISFQSDKKLDCTHPINCFSFSKSKLLHYIVPI